MSRRRAAAAALVCAALGTSSAALASSASSASSVPPQDKFSGRITGGTGAFGHANGRVSITISVHSSSATSRPVTLAFHGKACGAKAGCIRLRGQLGGTLSPGPAENPDAGRAFDVAANGRLKPIGHAHAAGTVHGTGFIARGQESMDLTLRNRRGSVTIGASSAPVPGFTGP